MKSRPLGPSIAFGTKRSWAQIPPPRQLKHQVKGLIRIAGQALEWFTGRDALSDRRLALLARGGQGAEPVTSGTPEFAAPARARCGSGPYGLQPFGYDFTCAGFDAARGVGTRP